MLWRRSCSNGAGGSSVAKQASANAGADDTTAATDTDATARPAAAATAAPAAPAAAPSAAAATLRRRLLTAGLLAAMNAGAVVFTIGWRVPEPGTAAERGMLIAGAALFVAAVAAFAALVRPSYTPTRYTAPLYPFLPCVSMALNVFLIGQLNPLAYLRFLAWTGACVACYALYAGAASWNKAQRDASSLPLRVPATSLASDNCFLTAGASATSKPDAHAAAAAAAAAATGSDVKAVEPAATR